MFDWLPPDMVPALLVFATFALGTLALVLSGEVLRTWWRRRKVRARLGPLLDEVSGASSPILRAERSLSGLEAMAARFAPMRDLRLALEGAGLGWAPASFLLGSAGLALAVGLAFLILSGSLLLSLLAAVGSGLGPWLYVRRKATRRLRKFEEQFPEAIDLMGRAIRAGHPLSAGIRMVGDEGPPAVAAEFRKVFEEQRFGLPLEDALMGLADRVDLVDVRIFVTAVLVQREVGGNLAEILDKISETIRARFSIRRQLRVYTAQGRISGYILALLPIAIGAILFAINPEYMTILFEEPVGRLAVGVAVAAQLVGYLWIRRIVDIEI